MRIPILDSSDTTQKTQLSDQGNGWLLGAVVAALITMHLTLESPCTGIDFLIKLFTIPFFSALIFTLVMILGIFARYYCRHGVATAVIFIPSATLTIFMSWLAACLVYQRLGGHKSGLTAFPALTLLPLTYSNLTAIWLLTSLGAWLFLSQTSLAPARRIRHFLCTAVFLPATGVLVPIYLLQFGDIPDSLTGLRSDSEYEIDIIASGRSEDCAQLGSVLAVDRCQSAIAVSQNELGLCDKIRGDWADRCREQIARVRKDPAVCKSVSKESERDNCYNSLAGMTRSVEPCLHITDREIQITCLSPFVARGDLEEELTRIRERQGGLPP